MKICLNCSQQFSSRQNNQKYCSDKCRNSSSVRRYRAAHMKECSVCGNRIRGDSTLCGACTRTGGRDLRQCTLADYQSMPSVAGKHPSWINSHVRSFARSWNSHLTKIPCQKCGYSKHVELCHIIPISQWPKTARLGDVNHQDNLLALCRNHHWEFDHKHLALSDIPQRN
jgi:hypothetical protein